MNKQRVLQEEQVKFLVLLAIQAGKKILPYYHQQNLNFSLKSDDSEVTEADLAANRFIVAELGKYFPDIAIVSEENSAEDNLRAARNEAFFMIDPLDGTRGFIRKSDQFTVNIALIKNQRPVFGVIDVPAQDITYYTDSEFKAWKQVGENRKSISPSQDYAADPLIISTKREPEKSEIISWLLERKISNKNLTSVESSYKFCQIAEGKADLYPRKVALNAWDIAAGEAIVRASGAVMCDYFGEDLLYNFREDFKMPHFIVSANFSYNLF